MTSQIAQLFHSLTNFQPRNFQEQTIAHLLQSQNILLRAPTGSGKTETAIAPFLIAQHLNLPNFPKKLIYIVPLRTLANSLRSRTQTLIQQWKIIYPNSRSPLVTLQTGENPEDPRFEGDIIFCTIDQILSSFLSIPYSVGRTSANLNAATVFASYLVFDELHLLDPDRSFTTTLKLLDQVAGIAPFLLMSATLTQELTHQIQQDLNPAPLHLITVGSRDLQQIEGNRHRTFHPSSQSLSVTTVLEDIHKHDRKRVIIICNTVTQAQGLYQEFIDSAHTDDFDILLLHSRFLPHDRKLKEQHLETRFGRNWRSYNSNKCQILIATQVIEAGMDLTCEILHTVLCPANSLLQRAGRCARFPHDRGEVHVYRSVQISNAEEVIEPRTSFLPYSTELCDRTWETLIAHQNVEQSVGFETEANWINAVHTAEHQHQHQQRSQQHFQFNTNFNQAIFQGDRTVAHSLIRAVDSRSVFMVEDETMIDFDAPTVDIRQLLPFSLPRNTLCNLLRQFQQAGHRDWLFKRVETYSNQESYTLPNAAQIQTAREINESISLIVNPRYASYDAEIGLRIGGYGNYRSEAKLAQPNLSSDYIYHMDTYTGHLVRMWHCWKHPFESKLQINGQPIAVEFASVKTELLKAGGRFIQNKIFPNASLEQSTALFEVLAGLSVLTHDLGKLQQQWQTVMHGWQKTAYDLYRSLPKKPTFRVLNPLQNILAHTDFQPNHIVFKQAYDRYTHQNQRPPHAVESAFLSVDILEVVLTPILEQVFHATEDELFGIHHALLMATGRHHSAWAKGWQTVNRRNTIELHPQANFAIAQTWSILRRGFPKAFTFPEQLPSYPNHIPLEDFPLGVFEPLDLKYQQLYWLIARALRLCDTRSVQL